MRNLLGVIFLYLLVVGCTPSSTPGNQITAIESDGLLTFQLANRPIFSFATEIKLPHDSVPTYYGRAGFIHPLYSPKGIPLTEGYPRGHTHQHGIFHAWTRSTVRDSMIDFWNQHNGLGTVVLKDHRYDLREGRGYLEAELQYLAYIGGDTLIVSDETWRVTVYPSRESYHQIDIAIEHVPRIDKLIIQDYHYGGFGFRASDAWNMEGTDRSPYDSVAYILTELGHDHLEANHSRPAWVAMWGLIEGDTAGVAVFSHPDNFRHPQPVRVHPSMPYFTFAPMVAGEFILTPANSYQARYRLIAYDGPPDLDHVSGVMTSFAGLDE